MLSRRALFSIGLLLAAAGCQASTTTARQDGADARKQAVTRGQAMSGERTCTGGHICCRGEECFRWIDDPSRACEPGFETVSECAAPPKPPMTPPSPPPSCGGVQLYTDGPDGQAGLCPPPPPSPPTPPSPPSAACGRVTLDPGQRADHIQLSADNLTASVDVNADSVNDSVRATLGLTKGRYYFETVVEHANDEGNAGYNAIGLASENLMMELGPGSFDGCGFSRDGRIECAHDFESGEYWGGHSATTYGSGAVVGVAADLDAARVWFSVNGVWQDGDPARGTGGGKLVKGETFYPVLNMSQGDRYRARFCSEQLGYPAPAGFIRGWGTEGDPLPDPTAGSTVDLGNGRTRISATCTAGQGTLSYYIAAEASGPELVVLGKYESTGYHEIGAEAPNETTVRVTKPSPVVLVLSSYEATLWHVDVAPGAQVQKIILTGYDDQRVQAPTGIPVETIVGPMSYLGCGMRWPAGYGGCFTPTLVSAAEQRTGRTLGAFGGCYQAQAFEVSGR